jgi:hypothetical protein
VSAQRQGSALASALALFDSQGNALAADTAGRKDFPNDPYLFASVAGGTYLIGVSGIGDIPGAPGGYDPLTGSVGSIAQTQPGGPFTLNVVATPIDHATTVLGLIVDHADPASASPTGFTLGFSGALGVNPAARTLLTESLGQGIVVLDERGRTWPVAAVGYNEANAQVSYLFMQPLPPGIYSVRLPPQGGLVDLAGLPPVALNLPPGFLSSFVVPAPAAPLASNNLGTILPLAAQAGVLVNASLAARGSESFRFVIPFTGFYAFQTNPLGGSVRLAITNAQNQTIFNADNFPGLTTENLTFLPAGIYNLKLASQVGRPIGVQLTVKLPIFNPESLLENGVGQGPALNLRLIAPTSFSFDPSSNPFPGPAAAIASTPAPAPSVAATVGWVSFASTSLVGQPGKSVARDSLAGPDASLLALLTDGAAGGVGYGGEAIYTARFGRRARGLNAALPHGKGPEADAVDAPTPGAMVTDQDLPGPQFSDLAAYKANWIQRISAAIVDRLHVATGADAGSAAPEAGHADQAQPAPTHAGAVLAETLQESGADAPGIRAAALTSPLSAGIVAALIVGYRHRIQRWASRLRGRRATSKSSGSRAASGEG